MGTVIGVTGGIATGKTTVTRYLQDEFHCPVLDADILAREAVAPGTEGLDAIARRYGLTMLQPDGTLDRARLGRLVFEDVRERRWLEKLIHPWVRDRLEQGIQNWRDRQTDHQTDPPQSPQSPPLVLAVPLLFEANLDTLVDQAWVVTCGEALQQQRLIARDRLTPEAAQNRIAAQMPMAEKCKRADVVIPNDGSLNQLQHHIHQVWIAHGYPCTAPGAEH